jgi:AcrR family transcriptional regulator
VQKTIAMLLDAAEQAVAEHGIERFTTTDVARIAGLSIGAVYKYFTDRVALLDVIRPHRFDAESTLTELRHQLQQFRAKTRTHLNADQLKHLDAMIALTAPRPPTHTGWDEDPDGASQREAALRT